MIGYIIQLSVQVQSRRPKVQFPSLRKFVASILLLAFSFSGFVLAPNSVVAQAKDPSAASKGNDKAKKGDTKKDQKAEPSTPTTTKSLGTKEDPTQIGKRKINSGTDKLFGWLGGSQDKEIALGRRLAMEVEQQAKMVDDPIVTEYINRVGQNVVLNSDAKVPFTIKVIDSDEVNAFALP